MVIPSAKSMVFPTAYNSQQDKKKSAHILLATAYDFTKLIN